MSNWVILRTRTSGVTIGQIVDRDLVARAVTLIEARRIWRWRGANTLMELAANGTEDTSHTRISEPAPHEVTILDVAEIINVADKAVPSLTRSRWAQ